MSDNQLGRGSARGGGDGIITSYGLVDGFDNGRAAFLCISAPCGRGIIIVVVLSDFEITSIVCRGLVIGGEGIQVLEFIANVAPEVGVARCDMPAGVEVVVVSHCGGCGRGLMEMEQIQLVQPEVVGMSEDNVRCEARNE